MSFVQQSKASVRASLNCSSIPTNPIFAPYGVDHCCECVESFSPCTNLFSMQPIFNKQTGQIQCVSTASDVCIQSMTNTIIAQVRCQIPQEEVALLYCSLPALIRQIMCQNPWLTSNDVVQWLICDILKEVGHSPNEHRTRLDRKFNRTRKKNESSHPSEDEEDFQSDSSRFRQEKTPVVQSSAELKQKNATNSSDLSSPKPAINGHRTKMNEPSSPNRRNESGSSINDQDSLHSIDISHDDSLDNKRIFKSPNARRDQSENDRISKSSTTRDDNRIAFPGKKDPNAIKDVEKCLAFYEQMRKHFDDEVAAMLLKCCLCYGDCSGKR